MNLRTNVIVAGICCCAALHSRAVSAQASVSLRELSKPEAISLLRFGAIESVHSLANGSVLVNDSRFRQLLVLDSLFSTATVAIDSTSDSEIRYGPTNAPVIRYVGDSLLFRDPTSTYFLVIDPYGTVVHRLIRTKPGETPLRYLPPKAHDTEGNPISNGFSIPMRDPNRSYRPTPQPIVRVNFATRREEHIAVVQTAPLFQTRMTAGPDGSRVMVRTYNPLVLTDDWAVLSDGTVAVVRGKDFQVDLFRPTGKQFASTKLPFDKRLLTDDEKRAEAAAALKAIELANLESGPNTMEKTALAGMAAMMSMNSDSIRKVARKSDGAFRLNVPSDANPATRIEFVPIKEMLNYTPPFRANAAVTDLDARLWILTTSTSGVSAGESVYEVVNNLGDHAFRVRVPSGRTIAGFGRNGVVYLKFRDGPNRWGVERRRLLN